MNHQQVNTNEHTTKKKAQPQDKRTREHLLKDMKSILAEKWGRRVMWDFMSHCKVFESIWVSSAEIHYRAGRQDVGHFILALINDASPEALVLMMNENKGEQ
jgi:hypothetical protein